MPHVFEPAPVPVIDVVGGKQTFPVHRIYCVGQNYAAHSREMGGDPDRQPPFFFSKPADAAVPGGTDVPYPPRTTNLHHEIELVVALGKGGANVPVADAASLIFGYAVGNDLTRRDLQADAKAAGRPWDTAKGFDCSAPVSRITPITETGELTARRIWIKVNDSLRQEGDLDDMIWSVPEIIAELSALFTLRPGDLIFTGTPAGVGPLRPGDRVEGGIDGLDALFH
ncbi:MAG: fumarylacetoacetate hydrolase family protein, partial [Sphingomonadales bacterium]